MEALSGKPDNQTSNNQTSDIKLQTSGIRHRTGLCHFDRSEEISRRSSTCPMAAGDFQAQYISGKQTSVILKF